MSVKVGSGAATVRKSSRGFLGDSAHFQNIVPARIYTRMHLATHPYETPLLMAEHVGTTSTARYAESFAA